MLSRTPPVGWKPVFQEMGTSIEVGYKFGAKAMPIGIEGGALLGFVPQASLALLMAMKPAEFKTFMTLSRKNKNVSRDEEKEIFGCERFQVAAAILQQLGFGTSIALGSAFGMANLDSSYVILDEEIRRWQAACKWIISLRLGRNYPGEPLVRDFFPEIKPGKNKERNLTLEVLHTEISRVRSGSSNWTWHLPYSSYEETKENLKLP
jgi:hypothetical protein